MSKYEALCNFETFWRLAMAEVNTEFALMVIDYLWRRALPNGRGVTYEQLFGEWLKRMRQDPNTAAYLQTNRQQNTSLNIDNDALIAKIRSRAVASAAVMEQLGFPPTAPNPIVDVRNFITIAPEGANTLIGNTTDTGILGLIITQYTADCTAAGQLLDITNYFTPYKHTLVVRSQRGEDRYLVPYPETPISGGDLQQQIGSLKLKIFNYLAFLQGLYFAARSFNLMNTGVTMDIIVNPEGDFQPPVDVSILLYYQGGSMLWLVPKVGTPTYDMTILIGDQASITAQASRELITQAYHIVCNDEPRDDMNESVYGVLKKYFPNVRARFREISTGAEMYPEYE